MSFFPIGKEKKVVIALSFLSRSPSVEQHLLYFFSFSPTFGLRLLFLFFNKKKRLTMAKSIRASVSKRNRATLRKNFFGPIVDARTERLHAKLQEIANQPRPEASEKSKKAQAEVEAGMWFSLPSRIQAHVLQTKQQRPSLDRRVSLLPTRYIRDMFESQALTYSQLLWMSTPKSPRAPRKLLVCKNATKSLATPLFSRSANRPASEDLRNERFARMN